MLRDVDFKLVYASGTNEEPIEFFYEAFLESKTLKLGLGYFSSSAIRVLAPGFAYFIANGGKMQIIINDELSEEDKDAIEKGEELNLAKLENSLLNNVRKLTELLSSENQLFFDCLSYLIATDRMEFVATVSYKGGIAHDKYGVFEDSVGDQVGFTGSANFSANALCYNAETITCFASWNGDSDVKRILLYKELFDSVWTGKSKHVRTIPIDKVKTFIKEKYPPKSLNCLIQESVSTRSLSWTNDCKLSYSLIEKLERIEIEPRFPYPKERAIQIKAYEAWVANNKSGIFAMATGAGKTITALNCVLKEYSDNNCYKAIIVVPTQALALQWEKEVRNFNFTNVVSTHSDKNWQEYLSRYVTRSIRSNDQSIIIITTYVTFNKKKFQTILDDLESLDSFTYIADEMHNLGSKSCLEKLPYRINKRIGLSATPERIYDEIGSSKLYDFFNSHPPKYTYQYTMKEAIYDGILCEYEYYPIVVSLDIDELDKYKSLTAQLMHYLDSRTGKYKDGADILLMRRKQIIHRARNKKTLLLSLIEEIKNKNKVLNYTFVFVPEGYESNYSQLEEYELDIEDSHIIDEYADIFKGNAYTFYKYIGGVPNPERILTRFANKEIDVLLSMKCLDEGVDIPRAETAIFCASTGNPRQFIQRRGRVLRKCEGKEFAKIYDMVVCPPLSDTNNLISSIEKNIFESEIRRVVNFVALSKNKNDILYGEIYDLCLNLGINIFDMLEQEAINS